MGYAPPPLPLAPKEFERRQDEFYAKHGRWPRATEADICELDPALGSWLRGQRRVTAFGVVCIAICVVLLASIPAVALVKSLF